MVGGLVRTRFPRYLALGYYLENGIIFRNFFFHKRSLRAKYWGGGLIIRARNPHGFAFKKQNVSRAFFENKN